MPSYVEIAVNVPQVAGVFHYHVPAELEDCLQTGHLVEVPFGSQRVQGIVLRLVSEPSVPETRPVLSLIDRQPVVTPAQIALAQHLAQTTLSSLAACIGLMLPPGLSQQVDRVYSLIQTQGGGNDEGRTTVDESEPFEDDKFQVDRGGTSSRSGSGSLSPIQARLVALLEKRGPLRGRQIDQAFPRVDWRAAARILVRKGLLSAQPVLLPPTVQPKVVRTVQLACPVESIGPNLTRIGKEGTAAFARRQAILRFLVREPGPVEVAWAYAESGGSLDDLRKLAELGLVTLGESEVWRDPLAGLEFQPTEPPPLTRDQQACLDQVRAGMAEAYSGVSVPPFLLHGVTGSGKTEIYLRSIEEALRHGKQAVLLVPEIALTPQTVRRVVSRFPGRVGLVHSRLSPGERYDTWRKARLGKLSVIVGPRSALFTPLPDLGLIILDEFHDDSYYQSDPPFYHAREAALAYARLAGAVCLLGSATPDIASAYLAAQGQWRFLKLPARILAHREAVRAQLERVAAEKVGEEGVENNPQESHYRPFEELAETTDLPAVQIVDMRQELKGGNRSIFSNVLQAALERTLRKGLQAILFLNRRGTATYVFCRTCGFILRCPRCDLPLTFHTPSPNAQSSSSQLFCHYCNYHRQMPKTCPDCGSSQIRQYGTGTERVEAEVQAIFPQARTLRWDYETTRQKGAHEIILSHFANHRADVLIGTQMLAKGLDLPLVTLVGVVLADVGLTMPDVFAAERTFQVLTQVAGRAGRSPLGGEVILQTFQPEHYVIRAASGHDYRSFYQQELEYRRRLSYPPFARLVRLEFRHADPDQVEKTALGLAVQLKTWLAAEDRRATEIIGPAPCFFARIGGLHRWQIILRGPDPASILKNRALGEWRIEVDPVSLL